MGRMMKWLVAFLDANFGCPLYAASDFEINGF
jgi:hypothetical protein